MWALDKTLSGITILNQSGPGNNDNKSDTPSFEQFCSTQTVAASTSTSTGAHFYFYYIDGKTKKFSPLEI